MDEHIVRMFQNHSCEVCTEDVACSSTVSSEIIPDHPSCDVNVGEVGKLDYSMENELCLTCSYNQVKESKSCFHDTVGQLTVYGEKDTPGVTVEPSGQRSTNSFNLAHSISDNSESKQESIKFTDKYNHPIPNVMYTECNIPGPGADPEDFEMQFELMCECVAGTCSRQELCACLARHGINYDQLGHLLPGKRDGPVLECNAGCACSWSCRNRLVQCGPRLGLQVFQAGTAQGLGLRCRSNITEGEFVCEYAGEVISLAEAKLRAEGNSRFGRMNYIFVLKEHLSDGKTMTTCVDPCDFGNIGRYVNHSCQPNTVIVPVRVDILVPKLCLFAITDIEAGQEITFDYSGSRQVVASIIPDLASRGEMKICRCGAKNCRKFLPFDETLF